MGLDGWFTLAVVVAVVVVLARDVVSPALAVFGATVVLLVTGVIDTEQALAGFSNPAPVTVAALYVLARAVEVTGALEGIVHRLLGGKGGERAQLARVVGPTAVASAFLNNTPIVAMVAPAVADWADRRGLPASRFLMPVSYAAILGGVVTAIGTSTNLVVAGLLVDAGEPALGLFRADRGRPADRARRRRGAGPARGAAACPTVAPPGRTSTSSAAASPSAWRSCPAARSTSGRWRTVGCAPCRGVYCVQVTRGTRTIAPVPPTEVLRGGDELTFVGKVDQVVDLHRNRGLRSTQAHHLDRVPGAEQAFFEAVVGEGSALVGRTPKEVGFRGRYQAAVLAIHRAGERVDAKLGEVRLKSGDHAAAAGGPLVPVPLGGVGGTSC